MFESSFVRFFYIFFCVNFSCYFYFSLIMSKKSLFLKFILSVRRSILSERYMFLLRRKKANQTEKRKKTFLDFYKNFFRGTIVESIGNNGHLIFYLIYRKHCFRIDFQWKIEAQFTGVLNLTRFP